MNVDAAPWESSWELIFLGNTDSDLKTEWKCLYLDFGYNCHDVFFIIKRKEDNHIFSHHYDYSILEQVKFVGKREKH